MSVSRELRITEACLHPDEHCSDPVDVVVGFDDQASISFVRDIDRASLIVLNLDEASALVDHLLDLLLEAGWHR